MIIFLFGSRHCKFYLGCRYFCIPVNILEFCWNSVELLGHSSFQISFLKFVRSDQSSVWSRAEYILLLKQDPSQYSTQCSTHYFTVGWWEWALFLALVKLWLLFTLWCFLLILSLVWGSFLMCVIWSVLYRILEGILWRSLKFFLGEGHSFLVICTALVNLGNPIRL